MGTAAWRPTPGRSWELVLTEDCDRIGEIIPGAFHVVMGPRDSGCVKGKRRDGQIEDASNEQRRTVTGFGPVLYWIYYGAARVSDRWAATSRGVKLPQTASRKAHWSEAVETRRAEREGMVGGGGGSVEGAVLFRLASGC